MLSNPETASAMNTVFGGDSQAPWGWQVNDERATPYGPDAAGWAAGAHAATEVPHMEFAGIDSTGTGMVAGAAARLALQTSMDTRH